MSVRAGRMLAVGAALSLLGACGSAATPADPTPSNVASSSSAPPPDCPPDTRCYDFATDTSGWPDVSDDHHYATHDTYRDGSYHVGVRDDSTFLVTAPVSIRQLTDDRAVRLSMTATTSDAFPDDASWGAACWTRPAPDGPVGGFAVHVELASVSIGVDNPASGEFHSLKDVDLPGVVKVGKANDLQLTCREDLSGAAPQAVVSVQVNDADPIELTYPQQTGALRWEPADGVDLIAAGAGADVFFDDVTVAAPPDRG